VQEIKYVHQVTNPGQATSSGPLLLAVSVARKNEELVQIWNLQINSWYFIPLLLATILIDFCTNDSVSNPSYPKPLVQDKIQSTNCLNSDLAGLSPCKACLHINESRFKGSEMSSVDGTLLDGMLLCT
jgi:hypothetical protein